MDKQLLREAFLLGFMVSREGYNGECDFDHLAPTELEPGDGSIDEFRAQMESQDEFKKLRGLAIDRITGDDVRRSAYEENKALVAKLRQQRAEKG